MSTKTPIPKELLESRAAEDARRVNEKMARLIEETIRKWELAGLQR